MTDPRTDPRTITPSMAADQLLELETILAEALELCCGRERHQAAEESRQLVRRMRERLGGTEIWIAALDKEDRNAAIRREFNGSNLCEIMARYQVSRATVYRVCGSRAESTVSRS